MSYSYNLSLLKESNLVLNTRRRTTPQKITMQWFEWSGNCTVTNQKRNRANYWPVLDWAWEILVQDRFITNIIHMNKLCHQVWKTISVFGTIYMEIYSLRSWEWLVNKLHQTFLASYLLKGIEMTTSMFNVVRSHVFIVNRPRSRPYYMAQQRYTKILSWKKDMSTTGRTWRLTWVLIKLCIMIGSLSMLGYSMPVSRIRSQKSWKLDIRIISNYFCKNTGI